MPHYDEDTRAAAVEAYLKFPNNSRKAIQHFKRLCAPPLPAPPGRFIKRWGQHWKVHHDLHDMPGRGRKQTLDPQFVRQVVKVFVRGYHTPAGLDHWDNFEVAVRMDEELAALQRRSGVSTRTLFLHMLQASLAAAAASA